MEYILTTARPTFIFLKGIFVQEGSSGTFFDHGQFEIKTFPIYACPTIEHYFLCISVQILTAVRGMDEIRTKVI